jgi:hypothetical protein
MDDDDSSAAVREQGVADIVAQAFHMYRAHARALIFTCAVLFVPAALVKSCAMAAILAPTRAANAAAVVEMARATEASRQALQEAHEHRADAQTIERLERENQRRLQDLSQRATEVARAPGGVTLFLLGVLAAVVTAFLFGLITPLTNAALTIAVADRIDGGRAGWLEVWMLLLGRLRELLSALIPAALLVAGGLILWVVPGMIVATLFALVPPVVLIERLTGKAALARSIALVRADWLRVALLVGVFVAIMLAARLLADLVIPDSAELLTQLIGDLVTLVVLPLPAMALVLLYLDIRRRDGFTHDNLRDLMTQLRD